MFTSTFPAFSKLTVTRSPIDGLHLPLAPIRPTRMAHPLAWLKNAASARHSAPVAWSLARFAFTERNCSFLRRRNPWIRRRAAGCPAAGRATDRSSWMPHALATERRARNRDALCGSRSCSRPGFAMISRGPLGTIAGFARARRRGAGRSPRRRCAIANEAAGGAGKPHAAAARRLGRRGRPLDSRGLRTLAAGLPGRGVRLAAGRLGPAPARPAPPARVLLNLCSWPRRVCREAACSRCPDDPGAEVLITIEGPWRRVADRLRRVRWSMRLRPGPPGNGRPFWRTDHPGTAHRADRACQRPSSVVADGAAPCRCRCATSLRCGCRRDV